MCGEVTWPIVGHTIPLWQLIFLFFNRLSFSRMPLAALSTNHHFGFIHNCFHTFTIHSILPLVNLFQQFISAITTKDHLSTHSNSHSKASLNSLASNTITNINGLNAESWYMPTLTSELSLLLWLF